MSDTPTADPDEDRDIILEPFRSISDSLDWKLRQAYWSLRGSQAFLSGEVPNLTINDGVLSKRIAATMYNWILELEEQGTVLERIRVLEIGAGLGVFARQVLERFKSYCLEGGRDHWERLEMIVTDRSVEILEGIAHRETFLGWEEHVRLGQLDATAPSVVRWSDGQEEELGEVHVVQILPCVGAVPFTGRTAQPSADEEEQEGGEFRCENLEVWGLDERLIRLRRAQLAREEGMRVGW